MSKYYSLLLIFIIFTIIVNCEQDNAKQITQNIVPSQPTQLTINTNNNNNNNTEKESCVSRVLRESVIGGFIGGGATAAVNLGSAAAISAGGFTTGGVAAGSVAAGVQSGIGLVSAGSGFASLQSLGALGLGILGDIALPLIIGVAAVGAIGVGGYVAYQCVNQQPSK